MAVDVRDYGRPIGRDCDVDPLIGNEVTVSLTVVPWI
jgi:hypothetical protein|eukprot:COSAG03_NODE_1937_length_3331_cov_1.730198_1_plen_37_part_00